MSDSAVVATSASPAAAAAAARPVQNGGPQGGVANLLAQRNQQAERGADSNERIGDLTMSKSSEKMFRFDEDDQYPLSGVVEVKLDTRNGNGVWRGRYDEFANGEQTKRWTFEMRRIEE